jgi:ABC-type glycerol-3-phosphate transport system permease component
MKSPASKPLLNAALFTLLGLALLPVVTTFAALFFDSIRLTQGLNLSSASDFRLANATAKFAVLFEDGTLFLSFFRSIVLACIVGAVTAWAAMASAFLLSRSDFGRRQILHVLAYTAYLTPPVILIISFARFTGQVGSDLYALLVVACGQSCFLFPLNFGLAMGHWKATSYELDRAAASDGANLWTRFRLHMSMGSPSWAFAAGLALLTMMLAWSDVLFSRFLLAGSPDYRLLTDLVIERLRANDLIVARGELAAVAVMCAIVASFAASLYALMFSKANAGR